MKLKIIQDENAESPAQWDDTGLFIVTNHRSCYIPEPGEKRVPSDPHELLNRYRKTHWIFPVEAYIHGGVRLALSDCGNFPDRQWDVSQVGFCFAAKSEWRLSAKARLAALAQISEWNQYFSGDVWGYVVEDENENHVDSCWGFYGREYCEQEGKNALARAEQAEKEEQAEAAEMACRDLITV